MSSPATGRLLLELLGHGPTSRADLARRLGLSTPTLTRLSKPLLAQGILRETVSAGNIRPGRPSRPLEIIPEAARFAGIKISRDGVDGVVIDLSGTVLRQRRAEISDPGSPAVTRVVARMLQQLSSDEPGVLAASVAVGGRVAVDRVIGPVAGFAWDDPDLVASLRAEIPIPVRLINDVHAYLLAEQWLGVGRGSSAFLLITVGVGIGCAYAFEGELMTGARSSAGLVGHWPLTADGPACPAGHHGCASGWLPSDQILQRVRDLTASTPDVDEAVARAERDPAVADVLRAAGHQLGRLTGLVADVVGPSRILLGGDGIGYARFAEADVRRGLAETRSAAAAPDELIISPEAGFVDWARGAAVAALVAWVDRVVDSVDQAGA